MSNATQPVAQLMALIDRHWKRIVIAFPMFWLLMFFALPFAIVLKISFADPIVAAPPVTPLFMPGEDGVTLHLTLDNYLFMFQDNLYWLTYLNSIKVAAIATLLCLLLGFPMAYAIARAPAHLRGIALLAIILPFWISFLLRVYAWMGILANQGLLNSLLMWLGLIEQPLRIMYTDLAMYIGMVYSYLPFMILPLYATLERLDPSLNEAAADLGAHRSQAFVDITLPLARPGIIAGCLLVFIPAMGEYVIPALLGGPDSLMIGRVLYDDFFVNRDWPVAAAVAVVLLAILLIPMIALQRQNAAAQAIR